VKIQIYKEEIRKQKKEMLMRRRQEIFSPCKW